MTTATAAPAWTKGHSLEALRAIRQVFTDHDAGLPLGAFTSVNEAAVVDWLTDDELIEVAEGAYVVARTVRQQQTIRGWNGSPVVTMQPGDTHVQRMAWRHGAAGAVADWLRVRAAAHRATAGRLVVESWTEQHDAHHVLVSAGAVVVGTKIRASSELFSIYVFGPLDAAQTWLDAVDNATEPLALGQLAVKPVPARLLDAVAHELRAAGLGWADHYSSYNQAHSWSALGLTSYTAPDAEPDAGQIVKPAEMSRKWKTEHDGWQLWTVQRTPLADRLPLTWQLFTSTLPAPLAWHRVRLMRLLPGGGELTRHSDITDPDVGTRDGEYMRLHLPIVTNKDVVFQQWLLDGTRVQMHMPRGQWCYIDTRKPHTARNGGTEDRIHLVADVAATPELRGVLMDGRQADAFI